MLLVCPFSSDLTRLKDCTCNLSIFHCSRSFSLNNRSEYNMKLQKLKQELNRPVEHIRTTKRHHHTHHNNQDHRDYLKQQFYEPKPNKYSGKFGQNGTNIDEMRYTTNKDPLNYDDIYDADTLHAGDENNYECVCMSFSNEFF